MSNTKADIAILSVQSSGLNTGSATRALSGELVNALKAKTGAATVTERDLTQGMPFVDEAWIGANFTDASERSPAQTAALSFSESLIEEIEASDLMVISAPMYNFSIPAALKAWIDQITRARRTFAYGPNGPEGLLKDKRAVIIMASGGVTAGSPYDFSTDYLKHILGFIGITDVTIITAEGQAKDADAAQSRAREQIDAFVADFTAA